jgi:hypothetical protein
LQSRCTEGRTTPVRLFLPARAVSTRLARASKRHYTFARRRLGRTAAVPGWPAYRLLNALICRINLYLSPSDASNASTWPVVAERLRSSLRLSVRTPPFHGGESGSIPLGSASTSRFTLIVLSFLPHRPNSAMWFGHLCSPYGRQASALRGGRRVGDQPLAYIVPLP